MRSTRGLIAQGVSLAVLTACADPSGDGPVTPYVEVVDGVEVASLPQLPGMSDPRYQWAFQPVREVRTVLDDDTDPLVYDPRALLPLRDGSILVHDPHADRPLVILDPDAETVLDRFGRRGQGPGELGGWLAFAETESGIVVFDVGNRQQHTFGRDGRHISSDPTIGEGAAGPAALGPGGRGFVHEVVRPADSGWERGLIRAPIASGEPHSLLTLPEPSEDAIPGRIQRGRALWAVMGDHVATMWSSRPVVTVHGVTGDVVRRIELPLTRRTLTDRDIQAQIAHYGGIARGLEPGPAALTNVLYGVGDGIVALFTTELWKAAEDPPLEVGSVWWRLFTVCGDYLGVVRLEDEFWPLFTGSGHTWARVLDDRGFPVMQELALVSESGLAVPPVECEWAP